MRTSVWAAVVLAALGPGTANAQTAPQSQPQPAPPSAMSGMDMGKGMDMSPCRAMNPAKADETIPPGVLRVSFCGKSTDWTPTTLAALPHTTLTVYNVHSKANQTYYGVPLIDLLTPLGVPAKPHGKDLRLYLVAEGSDGYGAVYAVAEVNPDVHDATVLVADTEDGKPIAADGPLKLIATGEKRPARWVRNLVAVRVLAAE